MGLVEPMNDWNAESVSIDIVLADLLLERLTPFDRRRIAAEVLNIISAAERCGKQEALEGLSQETRIVQMSFVILACDTLGIHPPAPRTSWVRPSNPYAIALQIDDLRLSQAVEALQGQGVSASWPGRDTPIDFVAMLTDADSAARSEPFPESNPSPESDRAETVSDAAPEPSALTPTGEGNPADLPPPLARIAGDARYLADASEDIDLGIDAIELDRLEEKWRKVVEYYPDLASLELSLQRTSRRLALQYKQHLLATRCLDERSDVARRMQDRFLAQDFGDDPRILNLARSLLNDDQTAGLRELKAAVDLFGEKIDVETVIEKIRHQFPRPLPAEPSAIPGARPPVEARPDRTPFEFLKYRRTLLLASIGAILGLWLLSARVRTDREPSAQGERVEKVEKASPADSTYPLALTEFEAGRYKQAAEIFLPLARSGHPPSQYYLGVLHELGNIGPINYPEAYSWFSKAARLGYAPAQVRLGHFYESGKGVAVDRAAAWEWYLKAAQQGDADGQFLVGWAYLFGGLVQKDQAQAFSWLEKSATNGHFGAQHALSLMYSTPYYVKKNNETAEQWYFKAFIQNEKEIGRLTAMWAKSTDPFYPFFWAALGRLYEIGRPFGKDVVLAYFYLTVASTYGYEGLSQEIENLAREMSRDQIKESRQLLSTWKAGNPLPQATRTGTAGQ